jgi:hypothetical protein
MEAKSSSIIMVVLMISLELMDSWGRSELSFVG